MAEVITDLINNNNNEEESNPPFFSLSINNTDYTNYLQQGFVLKDTLTEELDSLTIILNNVDKTLFESFEDVVLTIGSDTYYFYVNTSQEDIFTYDTNKYQYTLSLVSQTKILERVQLPNLKIRKSITGTTKTIPVYLSRVVLPYIQKQFPFITLDSSISDFSTVKCPEIEWNHPTAKQVINDLLSTIDNNPCLVRVRNNKIGYVSLAPQGNDISNYTILRDERYEQMQDFANNIVMDVSNIIPNKQNKYVVLSPRAMNDAYLTTDNCELVIPNAQIESIQEVKVPVSITLYSPQEGGGIDSVSFTTDFDITDYVLEESLYNTLNSTSIMTVATSYSDMKKYKRFNMYFKQGGDTIYGCATKNQTLFFTTTSIHDMLLSIATIKKNNGDFDSYGSYNNVSVNGSDDARNIVFKIKYSNVENGRIKVCKSEKEDKDVSFYQNQNQSQIDLKALFQTQRENVNRLGNEQREIDMLVSYDTIPQLGDYVGDYILAIRELSYYNDFVMFKGTFSKNYIKKQAYYGLTSRKRYTQLAQASESVIREEFNRFRINFTTDSTDVSSTLSGYLTTGGLNLFANYIASYFACYNRPIKSCFFGTNATTNNIIMFPTIFTTDKSVLLTMSTYDNYSVGLTVEQEGSNLVQNYVPYVDSYGETNLVAITYSDAMADLEDNTENKASCKKFPYTDYTASYDTILYMSFALYKDNSEALKITNQFDFVSEDKTMIIGNVIGSQNIMTTLATPTEMKIYASMVNKIDEDYPILDDSFLQVGDYEDLIVSNNGVRINVDLTGYKAWGIKVGDDLLLGCNKSTTLANTFYINVKGDNN